MRTGFLVLLNQVSYEQDAGRCSKSSLRAVYHSLEDDAHNWDISATKFFQAVLQLVHTTWSSFFSEQSQHRGCIIPKPRRSDVLSPLKSVASRRANHEGVRLGNTCYSSFRVLMQTPLSSSPAISLCPIAHHLAVTRSKSGFRNLPERTATEDLSPSPYTSTNSMETSSAPPLKSLRVKSRTGAIYGTDPDMTWNKMPWVSDNFLAGSVRQEHIYWSLCMLTGRLKSDWFEYAMGMRRGELETGDGNLGIRTTAERKHLLYRDVSGQDSNRPSVHPHMLDSLIRGEWAIIPDDLEQFAKINNKLWYNVHNPIAANRAPLVPNVRAPQQHPTYFQTDTVVITTRTVA